MSARPLRHARLAIASLAAAALAVLVAAMPVRPAVALPPDGDSIQVPLTFVHQGRSFRSHVEEPGLQPLAGLGARPGNDVTHDVWDAIIGGEPVSDFGLARPNAEAETVVVLQGPVLNMGEHFGPVEITRRDRRITVVVESWRDNRPRFKNMPGQDASMLSLGVLEPGRYEITVQWRELFLDYEASNVDYRPVETRAGRLEFNVAPPAVEGETNADAGASGADEPAILRHDQCVPFPFPRRSTAADRRRLDSVVSRAIDPDRARPEDVGLAAGRADVNAWAASGDPVAAKMLILDPVQDGSALYARVVTPALWTGWRAELHRLERDGTTFRLVMDVWADFGPRDRNVPRRHVIAVPLDHLPDGTYTVAVQWRLFTADTPAGPYRMASADQVAGVLGEALTRSVAPIIVPGE